MKNLKVAKQYLLIYLSIFFFFSCGNEKDSKTESLEEYFPESLMEEANPEDLGPPPERQWEVILEGKCNQVYPPSFCSKDQRVNPRGFAILKGQIYAFRGSIYRLEGQNWNKLDIKGPKINGQQKEISKYAKHFRKLNEQEVLLSRVVKDEYAFYSLNLETKEWKKISDHPETLKTFDINSDRIAYSYNGTKETKVAIINLTTKQTTDLGRVSQKELDGKSHVSLSIVPEGVVYNSNYSGSFCHFGSQWESCQRVREASQDGTFYDSYEKPKYTQIMYIDQRNPETKEWETLFHSKGYKASMYEIPFLREKKAILGLTGRFGDFVLTPERLYTLPYFIAHPKFPPKRQNSRSTKLVGFDEATKKVYLRYSHRQDPPESKAGRDATHAIIAIKLDDLRPFPFTSNNIKLSVGKYLSHVEGATVGALHRNANGFAIVINENNTSKIVILDLQGQILAEQTLEGLKNIKQMASAGNHVIIASDDGFYKYDNEELALALRYDIEITKPNSSEIYKHGTLTKILNSKAEKKKIDTTPEGFVALLAEGKVSIFTNGNYETPIAEKGLNGVYVEDVAVHSETNSFFLVGFKNQTLPSGLPVQSAFLRAYALDSGELKWKKYDFAGKELTGNEADARLYHVKTDGKNVLVVGENAGTNSVFRFDGEQLNGTQSLTNIDHWNDTWGSGGAGHLGFHGAFVAETGEFIGGQMTSARKISDGKTNSYRVKETPVAISDNAFAITAKSSCCIANRENLKVNGKKVGSYAGNDGVLMVGSKDFRTRYVWTTFGGPGKKLKMTIKGLSLDKSQFAIVGEVKEGEGHITEGEDQTPGTIYFATGELENL